MGMRGYMTFLERQNEALNRQVAALREQLQKEQAAREAEVKRCQDLQMLAQERKQRLLSRIEKAFDEE